MAIKAENISKRYFRASGAGNNFMAVEPTSIAMPGGVLTVITGRSGSGKTTLLNILSGLLTPSSGNVFLDDIDLYALPDSELAALRCHRIGVIPQGRAALDTLTVMENILLPGLLDTDGAARRQTAKGNRQHDTLAAAEALMERLGIAHLRNAMPAELSGGELRRLSIVRALAQQPDVILADEPTGDLDDENTKVVLALLRSAADAGAAVILSTHEAEAVSYADIVLRMDKGVLAPANPGRESSAITTP